MKRKFATFVFIAMLVMFITIPTNVNAADKLSLNKNNITLEINDTYKLKLGKIKATDITWWSGDKTIATVSKWGTVTAKRDGTVKIIAKYKNVKYTCTIKIVDYSDWVLYSTSNFKNLVDLILRGHVVYINGKYYCSPEYMEMLENEHIVYEDDASNTSNDFEYTLTPDAEIEFSNKYK